MYPQFMSDTVLVMELAMTFRFGLFVLPTICWTAVKGMWYCIPYLLFAFVYPAYACIPLSMYLDCVYQNNTMVEGGCGHMFIRNLELNASPNRMAMFVTHIRNDMDSALNHIHAEGLKFTENVVRDLFETAGYTHYNPHATTCVA